MVRHIPANLIWPIVVAARLLAAKHLAQLGLCSIKNAFLRVRQVLACAVAIKDQHRQSRAIGIGLAPLASLGGTLQGRGDPGRIFRREHALLKVERIAVLGHVPRPALAGRRATLPGGAAFALGSLLWSSDLRRHGATTHTAPLAFHVSRCPPAGGVAAQTSLRIQRGRAGSRFRLCPAAQEDEDQTAAKPAPKVELPTRQPQRAPRYGQPPPGHRFGRDQTPTKREAFGRVLLWIILRPPMLYAAGARGNCQTPSLRSTFRHYLANAVVRCL